MRGGAPCGQAGSSCRSGRQTEQTRPCNYATARGIELESGPRCLMKTNLHGVWILLWVLLPLRAGAPTVSGDNLRRGQRYGRRIDAARGHGGATELLSDTIRGMKTS